MITIGILAHVDAGKTTLSENILYECGSIKKAGRVDNGDTTLDTHELEKKRGITIFSSRAVFSVGERKFTLLDTPGHTDFSAEMERTLSVLDYAILVVSAPEGVQGHTRTLFELLKRYDVPAFIFVNKMDRYDKSPKDALSMLKKDLSGECVDFSDYDSALEEIAACDEKMMEDYFSKGEIDDADVIRAIIERKIYPVYFGSALKDEGVKELLCGMGRFMSEIIYGDEPCALVYKITHDEKHNRLTHLKVLGGSYKVRDTIGNDKISLMDDGTEEKNVAKAGEICTVAGLNDTYPGQGIGVPDAMVPVLEAVMSYKVIVSDETPQVVLLDYLKEIEEESPELKFSWDEEAQEIKVKVMGLIQLEILKEVVLTRFGVQIDFGQERIVYKESITGIAEGVGHYEPLRHYAEVHLKLEPGERGSGIVCKSAVSSDLLATNWQRLIYTHVMERIHRGVLTGSELTDVVFTITGGRAHVKHTEGGDFRQSTYRAVRQGLMELKEQGECQLLEPYYDFIMTLPQECLGRAMTDIDAMHGKCLPPEMENETAVLKGYAPVSSLWDYQNELIAYTKGFGGISLSLRGYDVCVNPQAVIEEKNYDPDADIRNPSGSVFCEHGAGVFVPWNEVKKMMHVESSMGTVRDAAGVPKTAVRTAGVYEWITTDEVDAIIKKAGGANARQKVATREKKVYTYSSSVNHKNPPVVKPKYLLVDGYNIIFAWPELKSLAAENVDAARLKLIDIISNYAGFREIQTAVVFDAYRLEHHKTEMLSYHNIQIVFTATAETADHYIERFTHDNASKYDIEVATSDGLEQIIIRSNGARLMSAANLFEEVKAVNNQIREIINGSF